MHVCRFGVHVLIRELTWRLGQRNPRLLRFPPTNVFAMLVRSSSSSPRSSLFFVFVLLILWKLLMSNIFLIYSRQSILLLAQPSSRLSLQAVAVDDPCVCVSSAF